MTRVTGESSSKRRTFSKALRGPDASASASRGCSAWLLVAAAGRGGSSREERSGDERPGAARARRVGFGDRRSCAVPSGCASEAGDAGACAAGMAVGRRHCFVLLPFASSATRRVVGPSAVVTVCPEDLLFCDRGYAILAAAPRSESPAFRDRGSPGRNRQRSACRQQRGRRRRHAVRRRDRSAPSSAFHESRARGGGPRRPNPETRKVREQVCARRAVRTRFAR